MVILFWHRLLVKGVKIFILKKGEKAMNKRLKYGSLISLVLMGTMFAGCGHSQPSPDEIQGYGYILLKKQRKDSVIKKQLRHLIRSMMGNILRILNLYQEMTVEEDILIRLMLQ